VEYSVHLVNFYNELIHQFMAVRVVFCLHSKYLHERKTSNLGVTYYVRSDFATGKDKNELASVERQVEEDYVVELQHSCYRERNNRESQILLYIYLVIRMHCSQDVRLELEYKGSEHYCIFTYFLISL